MDIKYGVYELTPARRKRMPIIVLVPDERLFALLVVWPSHSCSVLNKPLVLILLPGSLQGTTSFMSEMYIFFFVFRWMERKAQFVIQL